MPETGELLRYRPDVNADHLGDYHHCIAAMFFCNNQLAIRNNLLYDSPRFAQDVVYGVAFVATTSITRAIRSRAPGTESSKLHLPYVARFAPDLTV